MKYIEERWDVPRGKSKAPPGYPSSGPFTGDLRKPEQCIDFIWEKYQEEGHAGSTTLKNTAPRPDIKDAEVNDTPKEEEKVEEAPEKTKTEKVEKVENKPVEKEPEETKPSTVTMTVSGGEPVTHLTKKEVQETLFEVLTPVAKHIGKRFDGVDSSIEDLRQMVQVLAAQHKTLLDIHKAILLLIGSTDAAVKGEDPPLSEEECPTVLQEALDHLQNAVILRTKETEESVKKSKKPESPPSNKEKVDSPQEAAKKDESATTKRRSKRNPASAVDEFQVTIDEEVTTIRLGDLANAKKFPRSKLVQVAAAVGAGEVRPEQDRIVIAQLIIDTVQNRQ